MLDDIQRYGDLLEVTEKKSANQKVSDDGNFVSIRDRRIYIDPR